MSFFECFRKPKKTEPSDPFLAGLISTEEREQKLVWYRSLEAQEQYEQMSIADKIAHMETYLKLIRKSNYLSLFERGPTYIDEFSKLLVLLAETNRLSFSGYNKTLSSESNPVLKYFVETFFRDVEENCIVNDLIACLDQQEEGGTDLKFIKRAFISLFYESAEEDIPYALHVENHGFFSDTVHFIKGSSAFTGKPKLPIDKNYYDPNQILIGSTDKGRKFYRFNEKPMILLACGTQERRNQLFNDVILHSLEDPGKRTKLIIFDHCSSFERFDGLPNLFWPIIRGSRRIDYMTEELVRLANARSEGRRLEKAEEIIVIFDDMVKLNATNLLTKIMEKSVSAHIRFIYPLFEQRVPVSDIIRFSEIVDVVSEINGFFNDEEVSRVLEAYSHILPEYDPSYYLCEKFLTWTENTKTRGAIISDDPLFKNVLKYSLQFQSVNTALLQKRYGIGYMRARELLEALEELGVLGKMGENGERQVLATLDEDEIDEIDRIRKGLL